MKNNIEKYFNQKSISVLDIVFLALTVIPLIVFTFVNGIGPICLVFSALFLAGFFISRSLGVKDSAVDEKLSEMLSKLDHENGKATIGTYDLKYTAKRGKDGKFRSECYVVSSYEFSDEVLKIDVSRIYLTDEAVTKTSYSIEKGEKIALLEELVMTANTNKQVMSLSCEKFSGEMIPIQTNDVESDELIKKVCEW